MWFGIVCNVPSTFLYLAEQNFSLLGGHFGHLSKHILYQTCTAQNKCETLTFMRYFYLFDP